MKISEVHCTISLVAQSIKVQREDVNSQKQEQAW